MLSGTLKNNDQGAIIRAHAHANQHNLPVRANDQATYYIGGQATPAIIQTDTDFAQAKFIIDDREIEDRKSQVFVVSSKLKPFEVQGIDSLKKNQSELGITFHQDCLMIVKDDQTTRFICRGPNRNAGRPQIDIFIVRKDGTVDPQTPIIWDFDQISEITAYLIDEQTLTITSSHFTTIMNQGSGAPSELGHLS